MTISNPVLDAIRNRKHMGGLMLQSPGPDTAQLEAVLEAGAAAPDHGKLVPFRFVVVSDSARPAFVAASMAAFQSAVPDADEGGLRKARGKAEQPPAIVALIACFQPDHGKIGMPDQWLTVGCVLQNIWLAAESMGFSCGVSSGRLMDTPDLRKAFALTETEQLVSVISFGTPRERMPPRDKPALNGLVRQFGD